MSERQEQFRVNGEEVTAKVKELLHEGNVRRIVIQDKDGKTVMEVPMTIGVVGAIFAPVLAAVGAAAALLTECTILVVREDDKKDEAKK